MKIYFAASIRGEHEKDNSAFNRKIIKHLQLNHIVLSEHLADKNIIGTGEVNISDKEIHNRDMKWIEEADVIIAEVSNPSLGVGYELGRAVEMGKKSLCLWQKQDNSSAAKLSAMIRGSREIVTVEYRTDIEAIEKINEFIVNAGNFI
jgi:nucleoside 2-deoxyribosyltransferase